MKTLTSLLFAIVILTNTTAFSQAQKTKQPSKSKLQPMLPGSRLEDYSYPYFAMINNASTPVTGCFISYRNISYFVTTRHNFYTPVNEKRKITKVMIFIDPSDLRNNSKVLSLDMTAQKIMPVCFDSVCTDIVLLPVEIPAEFPVNYVGLEPKENIRDREMSIVGFVKDSIRIVKTKFVSFRPGDSTYFFTEKSALNEQAGSPVLIYSAKGRGVSKVMLAGVYSGKELSQEYFDKGLISTAGYITKFLDYENKIQSLPSSRPVKAKKLVRNQE